MYFKTINGYVYFLLLKTTFKKMIFKKKILYTTKQELESGYYCEACEFISEKLEDYIMENKTEVDELITIYNVTLLNIN